MNNPFSLGFVALFDAPLDEARLGAIVSSWLARFERLEQVAERDVATAIVREVGEVRWGKHLQFRLMDGDQFAWIYVTQGARVIETTGTPNGEEASLCLTLLMDLPGIEAVVPDHDEARLTRLEAEGLL